MIVKKKETRRGDNEQTCRYRAGYARQRHADVPHPCRFHFESSGLSDPTASAVAPPLRFHSAGCRTTKANKKRRCLPLADRSEVHSSKGLYNVYSAIMSTSRGGPPCHPPASSACFGDGQGHQVMSDFHSLEDWTSLR
jgi:hypothetical protein